MIPKWDSYEHLVQETLVALDEYKACVDKFNMNPSDRKKLLSLPFFLSKRHTLPEPRRGQPEFDLFTKLTGSNWYDDAHTIVDEEFKITEFDYENYIHPDCIPPNAANDPEFKKLIRIFNLFTQTKHERL